MQGNPTVYLPVIETTSNAIECLSLGESDTPERKACVTELVQEYRHYILYISYTNSRKFSQNYYKSKPSASVVNWIKWLA